MDSAACSSSRANSSRSTHCAGSACRRSARCSTLSASLTTAGPRPCRPAALPQRAASRAQPAGPDAHRWRQSASSAAPGSSAEHLSRRLPRSRDALINAAADPRSEGWTAWAVSSCTRTSSGEPRPASRRLAGPHRPRDLRTHLERRLRRSLCQATIAWHAQATRIAAGTSTPRPISFPSACPALLGHPNSICVRVP